MAKRAEMTEIDLCCPPPRSKHYADKDVKSEACVRLNDKVYYRRIFTDGSAELVRFDEQCKRWVVLCFQAA